MRTKTQMNGTSSADFNLGFSLGDEIPDGESTRLSEGIKPPPISVVIDAKGDLVGTHNKMTQEVLIVNINRRL